jgi:hypothetical protein
MKSAHDGIPELDDFPTGISSRSGAEVFFPIGISSGSFEAGLIGVSSTFFEVGLQ